MACIAWEGGYAALTTLVLVLLVSMSVVSGFSFFTFREVEANRAFTRAIESRGIAESGLEDAVYRVVKGKQITNGELLGVGNGTTTLFVTTVGSAKTIRSEGVESVAQQNWEVRVDANTVGTSFTYGLQIGEGGLEMENNSQVIGSVYSMGDIHMTGSSQIIGDAFAASASRIYGDPLIGGSARAHQIDDAAISGSATSTTSLDESTMAGSAHADSITNSIIVGDAYYLTSISGSTVLGTQYPSTPPPTDLPEIDFAISDAQITQWEAEAAAGGTYTGACPYMVDDGITTLGPLKIPCDMKVKNDAVVIMNGTLWITGNLYVENTAIIKLDASYGSNSGVMVVDNPANRLTSSKVIVQNSSQLLGSGSSGSYIMVVSQNNSAELGGIEIAIEPKNSANAAIYYATHGKLLIQNSTALKEANAFAIQMKNSSTLTYESGLADVKFSSGPTGGFDVKYWKEVQ